MPRWWYSRLCLDSSDVSNIDSLKPILALSVNFARSKNVNRRHISVITVVNGISVFSKVIDCRNHKICGIFIRRIVWDYLMY